MIHLKSELDSLKGHLTGHEEENTRARILNFVMPKEIKR